MSTTTTTIAKSSVRDVDDLRDFKFERVEHLPESVFLKYGPRDLVIEVDRRALALAVSEVI